MPGGKRLTIVPGQIVKFHEFAGVDLMVNGTLVADGTVSQPIIFTAGRDDFVGSLAPEIKSLRIKGIPGSVGPSFEDSLVAAPSLGKVILKGIEPGNEGIAFGIAANRIKSYARTGIRPLSNLDAPPPTGEADRSGDYVVRLL